MRAISVRRENLRTDESWNCTGENARIQQFRRDSPGWIHEAFRSAGNERLVGNTGIVSGVTARTVSDFGGFVRWCTGSSLCY